jgi:hypothetical protein
MKLRIRGNSIRLRLTQSEVAQLATEGLVENVVTFGSAELRYSVTRNGDRVTADLSDNKITVSVPEQTVFEWANSEEVGIKGTQPVPDGELHVLIEKDFTCLKPRPGDEDADAFANPLAAGKG